MRIPNKAVLLVNLGTPKSYKVSDVRRYLIDFLDDGRVIDIPILWRKLLVRGIIANVRCFSSAKIYKTLFNMFDGKSPLLTYSIGLEKKLRRKLSEEVYVEVCMTLGEKNIKDSLERFQKYNFKDITIIPLYPQYASATSGLVMETVFNHIKHWWTIPNIKCVTNYTGEHFFIDAFIQRGKQYDISKYDNILFSFHGVPVRHVDKTYAEGMCDDRNCTEEFTRENQFCYKANCFQTAELIAKGLHIDSYDVVFQSRLGRDRWLEPYAEPFIINQAKLGHKKLLVFSPSFVADCLETVVEIGVEYNDVFKEYGGEKLDLVSSLNDEDFWVKNLSEYIRQII